MFNKKFTRILGALLLSSVIAAPFTYARPV